MHSMLPCRRDAGNMLIVTNPLEMLLLWIIFVQLIHYSIAINVKRYAKEKIDINSDAGVNAAAIANAENSNSASNLNATFETINDNKRFMKETISVMADHNTNNKIIENLQVENEISRMAKNGRNHSTKNVLTTVSTSININLTRQRNGDLFTATGLTSCNADMCISLSSGTAFWVYDKINIHANDPLYRSTLMHDKLMTRNEVSGGGSIKYRKDLLKRQRREEVLRKSLMSSSLSLPLSLSLSLSLSLPLMKDNKNDNNNRNSSESCQCRCLPYLSTYREDLGICVDDIHECSPSPFVSGALYEKIPFVFLPLKGQIIYPSREIRFPDILTPVCVVTGAQYLTTNGWTDLRNPIDTNYPFRMFRDEGHSFIQWLGEADLRHKIQGRLIVVHLVCRDMALSLNTSTLPSIPSSHAIARNVFSSCVAFRINGSPINHTNNVSEVLFQSETSSTKATTSDGITLTKEYIVIGTCTLLLVLIYISSVFLYFHMKKRKNHSNTNVMHNALDDFSNQINYPKNDQVIFGSSFARSGSLLSAGSLANAITNEPHSRNSLSSLKDDISIVKNNPLLQHFPQLNENHFGFSSDISNSASECEMDNNKSKCSSGGGSSDDINEISSATDLNGSNIYHDRKKQMKTSVLVHPQINYHHQIQQQQSHHMYHIKNRMNHQINEGAEHLDCTSISTEGKECLPTENVAIIEDIITEEKLENLRAMLNGSIRKKLYFNPSYFEPHLLAEPPPAALEFLQKIREVISIAKYKMAAKRYQPSLIMIPEEGAMCNSNTPSPYDCQNLQNVSECHGCVNNNNINHSSSHLKNCGEKLNSIKKWLQTVHSTGADTITKTEIETETEEEIEIQANIHHGAQGAQNTRKLQQLSPPIQKNTSKTSFNDQITETDTNYSKHLNKQNNLLVPTEQKRVSPNELPAPLPPFVKIINNNNNKSNNKDKNPKLRSPSSLLPSSALHQTIVATTATTNAISKELDSPNASMYEACRIPQLLPHLIARNKLEDLIALTKVASIYDFAETGSEIYNNPKFSFQDSPTTSQRRRGFLHKSKQYQCSLKHFDLLNPTYIAPATATASISNANVTNYSEHQQYYDIGQLFTMDNNREKVINNEQEYSITLRSNNRFHLNIPTPDYDSTMEKKNKDIYNNPQGSGPSVPTQDYSSLSRKSLKQYQPDSPIYRRKSPQYLIVDYETDSLERSVEKTKDKLSSQSSSSPSSDVSSQLSPSLSTALPMEEELEVTHTVFRDRCNSKNLTKYGRKWSTTVTKTKTSGVLVTNNANKVKIARIKYDTPFQGSMTIEVEHEPPSDLERSTDSDQYEPDTLDRKPRKQIFCDASNWLIPEELERRQREQDDANTSSKSSNDNIKYNMLTGASSDSLLQSNNQKSNSVNFESTPLKNLRKISSEQIMSANCETYQTLLIRQNSCHYFEKGSNSACLENRGINKKGRILTLEAKHSRRQRPSESSTPPPPDVEISKHGLNGTTIRISTHKSQNLDTNNLSGANCSIDLKIESENNSHTIEDKNNYQTREDNTTATPSPISTPMPKSTPTPSTKQRNSAPISNIPLDVPGNSTNTTLSKRSAPRKFKQIPLSEYLVCLNSEDESFSNPTESMQITGISETTKNFEIESTMEKKLSTLTSQFRRSGDQNRHNNDNDDNLLHFEKSIMNKLVNDNYSATFNTHNNELHSDYSLNKYMTRRKEKLNDNENDYDNNMENNKGNENHINIEDSSHEIKQIINAQHSDNTTLKSAASSFNLDFNRVDNMSLCSRSNWNSSRLTQHTTGMYRNARVPVGIAYPQRNNTNNNGNNNNTIAAPTATSISTRTTITTNVQNVYHCEIEPVQLPHGMQIAVGLKDRPSKKTKGLKRNSKSTNEAANANINVNSHSITSNGSINKLQQTESIIVTGDCYLDPSASSSLILANTNYYEQHFGIGSHSIRDSGYLNTDSIEVLKRGYYDHYNYRLISNRERIINVDTIENDSNNESRTNFDDNSYYNIFEEQLCIGKADNNGLKLSGQNNNLLYKYDNDLVEDESQAIEDDEEEIMKEAAAKLNQGENKLRIYDEIIDNDSDKTLIYSNTTMIAASTITTATTTMIATTIKPTTTTKTLLKRTPNQLQRKSIYISNYNDDGDDEPITTGTTTPSTISSETDNERNAEGMWESGAESIETHSVLYKNITKQLEKA